MRTETGITNWNILLLLFIDCIGSLWIEITIRTTVCVYSFHFIFIFISFHNRMSREY